MKKINSTSTIAKLISNTQFAARHLLYAGLILSQLSSVTVLSQQAPLVPGPQPVPVTQPAAKLKMDEALMEQTIGRAAELYAREVTMIIGGAMQLRNSVQYGVQSALHEIGDYRLSNVYTATMDYTNGKVDGRFDGGNKGRSAGESKAKSVASRLAEADVNQSVDLAIESKKPGKAEDKIVWSPNPRKETWFGEDPGSLRVPESIDSQMRSDSTRRLVMDRIEIEIDDRLPSDLMGRIFDSEMLNLNISGPQHLGPKPGFGGITKPAFDHPGLKPGFGQPSILDLLPRDYQRDQAFDSWLRNRLRTQSDVFNRAVQLYKTVSDSAVYAEPAANQNAIREVFMQAYEHAIRKDLPKQLSHLSARGAEAGSSAYKTIARNFAMQMGERDGYIEVYKQSSLDKYNELLKTADLYTSYFNQFKSAVQTQSRVGSEIVRIVSEENLSDMTIGDTIDVYVDSLINRGMVTAQVQVESQNSFGITVMGSPGAVQAPGLTKSNPKLRLQRQMWISDISTIDQVVTAEVLVGGKSFRQDFRLSFEAMVERIVNPRDLTGNTANHMMGKITTWMREQMLASKNMKAHLSGDKIKQDLTNMEPSILLFRLMKAMEKMDEQERSVIRAYGQQIRDAIGNRPDGGGFANPPRRYWERVQGYIEAMQLPGSTPKDSIM